MGMEPVEETAYGCRVIPVGGADIPYLRFVLYSLEIFKRTSFFNIIVGTDLYARCFSSLLESFPETDAQASRIKKDMALAAV